MLVREDTHQGNGNVADDIFRLNQKDERSHHDDHIFEKYKGQSSRYTGSKGIMKEFHLVLYKGTKIVHSLYPSKTLGAKPPKRVLKDFIRAKDKIGATTKPIDKYFLINIPYENKEKIVRYVIIFKLDKISMMAKGYIQVNALNGCPIFTTYPELCHFKINTILPKLFEETNIEFVRFINGLTLADLSKLKVIIDKIETDLQKKLQSE